MKKALLLLIGLQLYLLHDITGQTQPCTAPTNCWNKFNNPEIVIADQNDSAALWSFRTKFFDNGGWPSGINWSTSIPVWQWDGVILDAQGYVIELNLSGAGITGPLPGINTDLDKLIKLDLSFNNISSNTNGQSLSQINLFANGNLEYLDLSGGNSFQEPILPLKDFTKLVYANLSGNSFNGPLPIAPNTLSTSLCYLDLSLNPIAGSIPGNIGNLGSLKYLNLTGTSINGEIPPSIGNLSNLEVLDLHGCILDTLPASMGNLAKLTCLDLSGCSIPGEIPISFKDLLNLSTLNLGANNLDGCIEHLLPLCPPRLDDYEFDQANGSTLVSDAAFMALCNGTYSCCPALTPTPDTTLCEGENLILQAGTNANNVTYTWTLPNGSNSNGTTLNLGQVTAGEFGTYHISADDGSCETLDSVIVDSIPVTTSSFSYDVDPTDDLTLLFTNNSTNFDSLRWNFGDGSTSTLSNPTHTYADTDTFYIICLTAYGICQNEITCDTATLGAPRPTMITVPAYENFVLGCNVPPCNTPGEAPNGTTSIDSFRISSTEITQVQYRSVMGNNPSHFSSCGNCPVDSVSWFDAVLYCNRLSNSLNLEYCYFSDANLTTPYASGTAVWWNTEANGYRLPTEAEWEHAAKGGNPPDGTIYAGSNNLDMVAWHWGNSNGMTHEAASSPLGSNSLNLSDMTGNVAEWCWGIYGQNDYQQFPACNPLGNHNNNAGAIRVIRGGSWNSKEPQDAELRVYNRKGFGQDLKSDKIGFRIAQNAGN